MKAKSFHPCFLVVGGGAFKLVARARMNSKAIVWTSLLLTLTFASRSYPAPLPINILDAQYTTTVSVWSSPPPYPGWPGETSTNYSRMIVLPVPISDSLYNSFSGQLEADANAGLSGISAFTAADGKNDMLRQASSASARSDLWFSPLTSETTTINMRFTGGGMQWYYSDGFVNLLDVTSGDEVWNFSWHEFSGTVPWEPTGGDPSMTATLTPDTDFIAGDTYELSMYTHTGSNPPDTELILIQLSGLEPVPEPSIFTLLGLGSFALAMVRRRR